MPAYKVLHVGNVAQNAYVNSQLLTRYGVESDVMAYDLYHFACSPEWYDYTGTEDFLNNDWFPNFYHLGDRMPRIGPNVAHGPIFQCLTYLTLKNEDADIAGLALAVVKYLRFKATMFETTTPQGLFYSDDAFHGHLVEFGIKGSALADLLAGRMYEVTYKQLRQHIAGLCGYVLGETISVPVSNSFLDHCAGLSTEFRDWLARNRQNRLLEALGLEYRKYDAQIDERHLDAFPQPEITGRVAYLGYWKKLMQFYDVCIFYGDTPIYAVFTDLENWCAFEHGTIRSIPFEDTVHGRLTKYAYQNAPKVFITNTDYITAKRRMEFVPEDRVYIPHPFDETRSDAFRETHVPSAPRTQKTFLCPARQDWVANDEKWSKGNDRYFRAAAQLIAEGHEDFVLKCVRWGTDVEKSDTLIEELGIGRHVEWIKPVSKRKLWELMCDCDCVVDQFLISGLGGVGFEAMALAKPLLTKDDGISNATFFGEAPPVLAADSTETVADQMRRILTEPDFTAQAGQAGLNWVREYHSAKRIAELQLKTFADVCDDQGGTISRTMHAEPRPAP